MIRAMDPISIPTVSGGTADVEWLPEGPYFPQDPDHAPQYLATIYEPGARDSYPVRAATLYELMEKSRFEIAWEKVDINTIRQLFTASGANSIRTLQVMFRALAA